VEVEERLGFVLAKSIPEGLVVSGGVGGGIIVVAGVGAVGGGGTLSGGGVEGSTEPGVRRVLVGLRRSGLAFCLGRTGESSVAGLLEGGSSTCGIGVDDVYEHHRVSALEQCWAGAWTTRWRRRRAGSSAGAEEEGPGWEPRRLIP
jgi:hypothetical protein